MTVEEDCICTWAREVLLDGHVYFDAKAEELLAIAPARAGNQKRYRFDSLPPGEALLKRIFDTAFQSHPECLIRLAEKLSPTRKSFYPKWKEVCWIRTPFAASKVFNNPLFKVAFWISVFCGYCFLSILCYRKLDSLLFQRVDTFLFADSPEDIALSTTVRAIVLGGYFAYESLKATCFTCDVALKISHRIHSFGENKETERLVICKEKTYAVWKQLTEKFLRVPNNDLAISIKVS